MRVSVSKKAHQALLLKVAAILQSDDPKDGLEHILNCWLAPSTLPPSDIQPAEKADTDITAIADW